MQFFGLAFFVGLPIRDCIQRMSFVTTVKNSLVCVLLVETDLW